MDKPVENCPDLGMSMMIIDDIELEYTASSSVFTPHRHINCTTANLRQKEDSQSHLLLTNNIRAISSSATMTDKFTIASFAVNVVAAILAIPTFLIEGKAFLSCFGKKRNCTSHQDLHCIKRSIFASNVLFLVWEQPTSLFCQHLPKTAIEWATLLCITKRNSSVIPMCAVRFGTGVMSFYPRIIAANICVLLQNRSF
jgi:hypothetical protein